MKRLMWLVMMLGLLALPMVGSAQAELTDEQVAEILGATQASVAAGQFSFDYAVTLIATEGEQTIDVNLTGAGAVDIPNQQVSLSVAG
ncbi:MAG: hypothetical protein AAF125_19570, partial [Chloroflexota bacterium]